MPPFSPFLIFGTVVNSISIVVPNAILKVTTSVGVGYFDVDANGTFSLDLAEIGYVSGETITIETKDAFNNETKIQQVIVTGFFAEITITLALRTAVDRISNLQQQNVLHSIGKAPITRDNPLSVTYDSTQIFEERRFYNGNGQVEFICEAVPGTRESEDGWRIQKRFYTNNRLTKLSWANFNAKFDKICNNRNTYGYR